MRSLWCIWRIIVQAKVLPYGRINSLIMIHIIWKMMMLIHPLPLTMPGQVFISCLKGMAIIKLTRIHTFMNPVIFLA